MYVKLFTRKIEKARYITRATSICIPLRRLGKEMRGSKMPNLNMVRLVKSSLVEAALGCPEHDDHVTGTALRGLWGQVNYL